MIAVLRCLLGLLIFSAVSAVALFIAAIWTGDERWAETGVVAVFVALLLAAAIAAVPDADAS